MSPPPPRAAVVVGTRGSALARAQTERVVELLLVAWPGLQCKVRPMVTTGDRTQASGEPLPEIGGKGLFTAELEQALRDGEIDLAVHSLKDLPTEDPPGIVLGAVCLREDVRDCLVARDGLALAQLPAGAVVGTSSLRRSAQLLALRPDLEVRSIRGNVDTRIRKVREGEFDAVVLAAAGIRRLGLDDAVTEFLSEMLPAPGQGALAVQCRAGDETTLELLVAIDDPRTRAATAAERAFLRALGAGCTAPVAAHAFLAATDTGPPSGKASEGSTRVRLKAMVASLDGEQLVRVEGDGEPDELGARLARQARAAGADRILEDIRRGAPGSDPTGSDPGPERHGGTPVGSDPTGSDPGSDSVGGTTLGSDPTGSDPGSRPLAGRRIVVTRPRDQAAALAGRLERLGATVTVLPLVRIEPLEDGTALDALLASLDEYDWVVFTSSNGVGAVRERLEAMPGGARVAAVGPATAVAVRTLGVEPAFVPERYAADAVAAGLEPLEGARVLLPQSDIAEPRLAEELRSRGATVDEIAAYRTVEVEPAPPAAHTIADADAVVLASGSAARSYASLRSRFDGLSQGALVVCIGPKTAAVAREVGLPVGLVADEATAEGIIQALVSHFGQSTT